MRSKARLLSYSLKAGAIISIAACNSKVPDATLLASKRFANFPSASALEYARGKVFVVGDDAPFLMVLDTALQEVRKIAYWPGGNTRIAKEVKPDLEAASILIHGDRTYLYAFGSMSTARRQTLFQFPLDSMTGFTQGPFPPKVSPLIREWNIEGAAMVDDQLVLANRANNTYRDNFLVLYTFASTGNEDGTKAKVLKLSLPEGAIVKGVSGLHYEQESDRLFFTASEEATVNAVDDGAIGESYIGWIDNFAGKMYRNEVRPDGLLKLSSVNNEFRQQKIESLCVLPYNGKGNLLLLAADNDNGESRLFKLLLRI